MLKGPAPAAVLALTLAGCAATAPPPPDPVHVTAVPPAEPVPPPAYEPGPGDVAVAALGTPFFIAFKAAVCAGTVAIAAPTSALLALGDPYDRRHGRAVLGDGLAQNCGPPYVLKP